MFRISSLFIYQFLFEPFQYFLVGSKPGLYLGRLISIFIIAAFFYTKKSAILIRSFLKSIFTLPFLPFSLWTIGGGIYALIHFELPFYKIRFGIIEPLIYFVYISLLIILPKSFLRKEVLMKIPKALLYTFSFLLIFGFLDFIFFYFGFNLLGRSIFDPTTIGQRFHSFAGEPRDYVVACIYFLSSLSIFFVSPLLGNTFKKYFKFYLLILIPLACISLILTKSITFIASASIFLIIIFITQIIKLINSLVKIKLKKSNFLGILLGLTFSLILFFVLSNSNLLEIIGFDRIVLYLQSFDKLQIYLRDGYTDFITYFTEIDELLASQLFVVYPLLEFFTPETASDLLTTFIGNGIGSTTVLLRTINDADLLQNSASQLARLLYEQGIIGFLFFLNIHFSIVKKSTLSINSSKLQKSLYFIFSTLILITYLVHRRSDYFLFLGINVLYLHDFSYKKKVISM